MRVLLACEFYYPSIGGVQEVMRQVAEGLAGHGHEVTVATTELAEREQTKHNGVAIREFAVTGNLVAGIHGEIDAYRQFVLDGRFDVLMVKAAQQWTFDALWPILDHLDFGKVFIPSGFSALYQPEFGRYFAEMPDVLRKFDHLVFYASSYRDIDFARAHGIERLSVIPNGASASEFSVATDAGFRARHGIPCDDFVILTVGTRTGMKGHRELAEAFRLARLGRPATLILDGGMPMELGSPRTGERRRVKPGALRRMAARTMGMVRGSQQRQSLEELVRRINAKNAGRRVMIVDLPRSELVQAFLTSDLFVLASQIEYSPLVLYEAAAAGLPFVSVPVGNAVEIAKWTGAGVICPAEIDERGFTRVDPAVLADWLSEVSGDQDRLRALGLTGRARWKEAYTWDRVVPLYEEILVRAAASHAVEGRVSRVEGSGTS